jgi:hypothetical protein
MTLVGVPGPERHVGRRVPAAEQLARVADTELVEVGVRREPRRLAEDPDQVEG